LFTFYFAHKLHLRLKLILPSRESGSCSLPTNVCILENIALVSGEDTQSSPSSSVSGCERQALLVTALSKAESSENTPPLYNSNEGPIRPRRSVHRFTSLGSSEHRWRNFYSYFAVLCYKSVFEYLCL